jgi:hypothetical protein
MLYWHELHLEIVVETLRIPNHSFSNIDNNAHIAGDATALFLLYVKQNYFIDFSFICLRERRHDVPRLVAAYK